MTTLLRQLVAAGDTFHPEALATSGDSKANMSLVLIPRKPFEAWTCPAYHHKSTLELGSSIDDHDSHARPFVLRAISKFSPEALPVGRYQLAKMQANETAS